MFQRGCQRASHLSRPLKPERAAASVLEPFRGSCAGPAHFELYGLQIPDVQASPWLPGIPLVPDRRRREERKGPAQPPVEDAVPLARPVLILSRRRRGRLDSLDHMEAHQFVAFLGGPSERRFELLRIAPGGVPAQQERRFLRRGGNKIQLARNADLGARRGRGKPARQCGYRNSVCTPSMALKSLLHPVLTLNVAQAVKPAGSRFVSTFPAGTTVQSRYDCRPSKLDSPRLD